MVGVKALVTPMMSIPIIENLRPDDEPNGTLTSNVQFVVPRFTGSLPRGNQIYRQNPAAMIDCRRIQFRYESPS